jgi:L,D-peptidoglycan transpeptidase YkuD (ErfK/YbiS/YcfS/YnhG family)
MIIRLLTITLLSPLSLLASPGPIPSQCRALLIAIPESWNSQKADIQLYRRTSATSPWTNIGITTPAHLGRRGLAWGRGLHLPQEGPQKREGDGKSPAGAFLLGNILYGYADQSGLPKWRYRKVTDRDLWIEDPTSTLYNRHLILSAHEPFPPEHSYHLMRQDDPAHSLKLFIRHNAPPDVKPGSGSAIFFHLCRSQNSVTTGCTSMDEPAFRELLSSFLPKDEPIYVLLPRPDYDRLKASWKLP